MKNQDTRSDESIEEAFDEIDIKDGKEIQREDV